MEQMTGMALPALLQPIMLSIKVAIVASLIVLVLGIVTAETMRKLHFRGKIAVETVLMLPLVLPPSVVGFGLLIILGRQSPLGQAIEWVFHAPLVFTWGAAVLAGGVVAFPLMYQSVKSGLLSVDREVIAAAHIDGADSGQTFFYVTLPLTLKFILSGLALSFARALGEFGATLMFAGNIPGKTQTIATAIYAATESYHTMLVWFWVTAVMVLSFLLMFLVQWVGGKENSHF